MRIDPTVYFKYLKEKFPGDSNIFCHIIDYFDSKTKTAAKSAFIKFWNEYYPSISNESEVCNYAYELFNNLDRYYTGGVFQLFKEKQAEWGAPRVNILKEDIPDTSGIAALPNIVTVYRGLSEKEHLSKDYAQSWTIDFEQAKRSAEEIYTDNEQPGIVVVTKIPQSKVIHYDRDDSEKEVIIEANSITSAKPVSKL